VRWRDDCNATDRAASFWSARVLSVLMQPNAIVDDALPSASGRVGSARPARRPDGLGLERMSRRDTPFREQISLNDGKNAVPLETAP
jgi:hypothetical protein